MMIICVRLFTLERIIKEKINISDEEYLVYLKECSTELGNIAKKLMEEYECTH